MVVGDTMCCGYRSWCAVDGRLGWCCVEEARERRGSGRGEGIGLDGRCTYGEIDWRAVGCYHGCL